MTKWLCNHYFWLSMLIAGSLGTMIILGAYNYDLDDSFYPLIVKDSKTIFVTHKNFLSVALDTSFMRNSFHKLSERDWETLTNLTRLLLPAYLRLGGTEADQVVFQVKGKKNEDTGLKTNEHNSSGRVAELNPNDSLVISADDWDKLNDFILNTQIDFLFDVNVLLRGNNKWNSTNAELLLNYSARNLYSMDFQLGNEPNHFLHVFNVSLPADRLATDFNRFRALLDSKKEFHNSSLIGPDVTRPILVDTSSIEYLKEFLTNTKSLSAVSWHQYYFNGRNASVHDFTDLNHFNLLAGQIKKITGVVNSTQPNLPVWLSETGTAYGGGAPGLSDRYVASFLWLDKLGLSAKLGISVVVRQTLFQGHYALIDSDLTPLPDFWISLIYKKLVGEKVLHIEGPKTNKTEKHLRFYAHCSKVISNEYGIIVFGMNLNNSTEEVVISDIRMIYPILSYLLTPENGNLTSKSLLLNGRKLVYDKNFDFERDIVPKEVTMPLKMPPYSIAFWLLRGNIGVCSKPCPKKAWMNAPNRN